MTAVDQDAIDAYNAYVAAGRQSEVDAYNQYVNAGRQTEENQRNAFLAYLEAGHQSEVAAFNQYVEAGHVTGIELSAGQQSAKAILSGALADFGLNSLGSTVWDWYLGGRSVEQIMLDIRNTPEYKTRFPAMQKLAQEGRAISESSYIDYERTATQLWHAAGLPVEQIDEGNLVTRWLEGDVSVNELSHRIQDLYVRVANTAPEVRNWYSDNFGTFGDAAIAASFADPESAVPVLERRAAASEFGGAGSRFGFSIGLDRALQAAGVGITASQASQGFSALDQSRGLFNETISENTDLTAEGAGVGATFGLDAGAARELALRTASRQAEFAGSATAGGIQTNQGLGVGRARAND